jgi:hypothetical protein
VALLNLVDQILPDLFSAWATHPDHRPGKEGDQYKGVPVCTAATACITMIAAGLFVRLGNHFKYPVVV